MEKTNFFFWSQSCYVAQAGLKHLGSSHPSISAGTVVLEQRIATYKRMKLEHCLIPCIKINSKWIKDLNLRAETKKNLRRKHGHKVS
jgi:hypothetical protein